MHISALKVAGFKSFVDPTEVRIDAGLTGVVGPNGCGKSNLLEALRWAMGATSAKAMRGVDMDDVIFAGTGARPARESAEVAMVLENALGKAAAPFHTEETLEISRRIRRGAGSDYRINGKPARAKDIALLFADASTGANSPALVRQGQISELIGAKPQNRRRILEEAAGIAGLAQRRHEAELKLAGTEENLARLADSLVHSEARLEDLRKQARKAERYRGLAAQIEGLEALIRYRRWNTAMQDAATAQSAHLAATEAREAAMLALAAAQIAEAEARAAIEPLQEAELAAGGHQRALESQKLERARDLRDATEAARRLDAELQRVVHDLSREQALKEDAERALAQIVRDLESLPDEDAAADAAEIDLRNRAFAEAGKAREALEARLEGLTRDLAAGQARRDGAQASVNSARQRAADIDRRTAALTQELSTKQDLASLRAIVADAEQRLAAAVSGVAETHAAAEAAETALVVARKAEADARAALGPLQTQVRSLEAELQGLERLLKSGTQASKFPRVIHDLHPEPGYERALAAALGDDVEASLDRAAPASWQGVTTQGEATVGEFASGIDALDKHVRAPGALAARLAQCGVVAREDGPRLLASLARGQRLVSLEGDLWRWDGFVRRADAAPQSAVLLEQRTRKAALESEIGLVRARFEQADRQHRQYESERSQAEDTLRKARRAIEGAQATQNRARDEVQQAERALASAEVSRASLDAQLAAAKVDAEAAGVALGEAERVLAALPPPPATHVLDAVRRDLALARQSETQARDHVQGFERERDRRVGRRRGLERDRFGWQRRATEAQGRIDALIAARQQSRDLLGAAQAAPGEIESELKNLAAALEQAERSRLAAADASREGLAVLRSAETRARAAQQTLNEAEASSTRAQLRLEAASERLSEAEGHARAHSADTPQTLAELAAVALGQDADTLETDKAEARLERLRRERETLGGINLEAQDDADEAEQRLAQVLKERDDLSAAVAKLREGVSALNSEARSRLLEAFQRVDGHFRTLFEALFEGGAAELRLADAADPLDAGLEIYACPPGKRLGHLSLMSGGEQALTATALIFAVFLSNPAPICVLDEVDAPLDDANVDRYCRMLDAMRKRTETRFMVITHNPVTMARMDRLYGVTMHERGVSRLVSVDLERAEALVAAK